VRDAEQLAPDALLEVAAGRVDGDVEGRALAREVFVELAPQLFQDGAVAGHDRTVDALLQRRKLRLEHAPIGELEQADPFFHRRCEQRPERALDPGEGDAVVRS
jgi:hypothetical protein